VLQTLDAMDGLAGTGQLVRLARKPHRDYRLLQIFQRAAIWKFTPERK
jgi:hypothetical protein